MGPESLVVMHDVAIVESKIIGFKTQVERIGDVDGGQACSAAAEGAVTFKHMLYHFDGFTNQNG